MIRDYSVGAFMGESGGGSRSGVRRRRRGRWGRFAPSAPTLLALLALGAWATFAAAPLVAQVGHRPESSPYRDIRRATDHPHLRPVRRLRRAVEIGPHDGQIYGLRYDLRTGSTIQFGLGFARADLQRPDRRPVRRLSTGSRVPVDQTVTFAEVNLQLNLTGGKPGTGWRPSSARGGPHLPQRHSRRHQQVRAGQEDLPRAHGGVRIFVTDRLSLRGEARALFLKLKYPPTFEDEPAAEPGDPPQTPTPSSRMAMSASGPPAPCSRRARLLFSL